MKKYQAIYSDNEITADKFAVELLCKRRADKQGITLCKHFWRKEHRSRFAMWAKIYNVEIMYIRSIIKNNGYSAEAIARALLRKECSWVLSSRNKKLEEFIVEEQRKLDVEEATKTETKLHVGDPNSKPRKTPGKKSKLNKLR